MVAKPKAKIAPKVAAKITPTPSPKYRVPPKGSLGPASVRDEDLIKPIDILPPVDLGLPSKFQNWRPGQREALSKALNWFSSDTRFMAMCMPTGSGKSLVYTALAKLVGRVCILTSTKGLQDQLVRDFRESGLTDIRGMGNYECIAATEPALQMFRDNPNTTVSCEEGPCHGGFKCDAQQAGCSYFDAKRLAQRSDLVVTNYSYFLRVMGQEADATLGKFDLLILDEAHEAPEELASSLEIEIGAAELEQIADADFPNDRGDFDWWRTWAKGLVSQLDTQLAEIGESRGGLGLRHSHVRQIKAVKSLRDRLRVIGFAKGQWVQDSFRDHRGSRKLKFDPIDVKEYADDLFREIPHILFVSATVRPKTLNLFGLSDVAAQGPRDHSFYFVESTTAFAATRRPIISVPTVKMRHGMPDGDMRWWVNKIDYIIDKRLDRRGIIHTTSYKRAQYLAAWSRHKDLFVLPSGPSTRDTIIRWKAGTITKPILVSPSVTTGWDFPDDECRYQIIGKVPFTDTRSKVLQAREGHDKDYGAYMAMQTLVQTCGRGVRSETDWCENLVVDDNFMWFIPRYSAFAPKWFLEAVKFVKMVPEALQIK